MKKILLVITTVMIALGAWAAVQPLNPLDIPNPDPNHAHADFAVWVNGEKLDFSGPEFMSTPPLETHISSMIPIASAHGDEEDGHVVPGREYLHLHDGNGHVIHRHKPGLTFGNFLESIGFSAVMKGNELCITLPDERSFCNDGEKKWRMHVNVYYENFERKHLPNFNSTVDLEPPDVNGIATWNYAFEDLDHILLIYADLDNDAELNAAIDAMTDDACLYSKRCPWRGEPPVENCIADPAVPCVE